MDYQVVLSPSARADLRDIVRYISFDAPGRALEFGRFLISRTKLLAQSPELGRVVSEFDEPFIREIIVRIHTSIRCTPAMEAGITKHVWELRDLLSTAPNAKRAKSKYHESRVTNTVRLGARMTVGQIIFELVKSLGIAAIVSWFAKSVITYFFSRKIEAYKIELKRESDKEVEEIKSRLHIAALERQIVFSRLQEKRADIIAEAYALFHELYSKAYKVSHDVLFAGLSEPKKDIQEVFEECLKFYDFFQRNRIYFGDNTCVKVDTLLELIGQTNMVVRRTPDKLDHASKDVNEAYQKIAVLLDQLPEIKRLLVADFRGLLGVVVVQENSRYNSSAEGHAGQRKLRPTLKTCATSYTRTYSIAFRLANASQL